MDDYLKLRRNQLIQIKSEIGVREDWHEPDEQEVDARVTGLHLDNAMGDDPYRNCNELTVVIYKEGSPVHSINLATLLAIATCQEA